jgi:uncharacterized SAM-binding protein YcdF (DUF218 family)
MFFVVSKVGFFLVQPTNICLLLIVSGLIVMRRDRWRNLGGKLATAGTVALLVAGLSPIGSAAMLPLEQRFPKPSFGDLGPAIDGIIILGGFEEGHMTVARKTLSLNEAAERLTEAVSLARRLPMAKVVFTGGSAAIMGKRDVAAVEVGDFLVDAGVARERLVLEDVSRNTRENATLTRDLVKPKPGSRWVLVTSAFHMPRSVGVFRATGFDVIAWPVDYRTAGYSDLYRLGDGVDGGLRRLDTATKEYIGLFVYRFTGWTASLWPGPCDHSAKTCSR